MDQDTSSGLIQNKNLENTLQGAEEIEVKMLRIGVSKEQAYPKTWIK